MAISKATQKKSYIISLVTLLVTLSLTAAISTRGNPVVAETNLEKLPMQISGMLGTDDFFADSIYRELNADKNLFRHYRSPEGRQVDLYIGYYGTAKGGRTGHNPIGCLPGQGWGLQELREIPLKSSYYPEGVPVNYLLSTKDDSSITTVYWYQSAGTKVLSSGIKQNINRFFGMVFLNRNDGAFVRITVLSEKGEAEAAKFLATSFSEQILSMLPNYWPVEK